MPNADKLFLNFPCRRQLAQNHGAIARKTCQTSLPPRVTLVRNNAMPTHSPGVTLREEAECVTNERQIRCYTSNRTPSRLVLHFLLHLRFDLVLHLSESKSVSPIRSNLAHTAELEFCYTFCYTYALTSCYTYEKRKV